MSKQLFNNPEGHRGSAIVTIRMHELYALLHERLAYSVKPTVDLDAVCQNLCVAVEKQQGTFPNLEPVVQESVLSDDD